MTLVVGAELKENAGAEVFVGEGALRLMTLGIDSGAGVEACMFAPKGEETGSAADGTMIDEAGGETDACDGLKGGADEQAAPGTATVVVESIRMVWTPSGPVELKVDAPFSAPGLGVAVGTGEKDDDATILPKLKVGKELAAGVEGMALEVTLPPKLNCRLFRLMTDGRAPGPFRFMTDGEGAGALRLMTGGLPGTCGPAIRPASLGLGCVGEGLFRSMTLGDGAGFTPCG